MGKFKDRFCPTFLFPRSIFNSIFIVFMSSIPSSLSVTISRFEQTYMPMYLACKVQMDTYPIQLDWGKVSKRLFPLLNLTYYYGKLDFSWSVSSRVFFESILFVLLLGAYLSIQQKSPYSMLLCSTHSIKTTISECTYILSVTKFADFILALYFYPDRIDWMS